LIHFSLATKANFRLTRVTRKNIKYSAILVKSIQQNTTQLNKVNLSLQIRYFFQLTFFWFQMRTLICLIAFALIFGVLAQSPCNVNGCTYEEATDGGSKPAPITFGDYFYTPKCLRVAAGTVVTFEGDLEGHPLLSGAFSNI
jgi:hypothetical protein